MLLKCLQFSLEFIAQFGYQRQLPTSIEISMFTTIVHGCHAPNSNRMRYVAFNALYSALEFYQKSMEDKETRGAILKAIKLAIASPDIQLVSKALDCLANAAKYHFKLLRKHESDMLSWMCVILCSSAWPSLCKTRAIQVWNNAVTNGKDTNLLPDQFAMKAYTLVILELLQPHADDVDDVEENELSASAAHGLKVLSRVLQDDIVPLVVHALEENLKMENWRLRGAAITAFSCILESVTTKVISLHIQRTLPTFLATLADPHTTLIHSTMSAVSNVCRYHIAALQEAQVHSILRFLINELKVRRGNTAIIAASAIASIAINCRIDADDDTSLLSVDMDPLITQLMLATEQGGSDNLRTEAAVAIANLITSGAKDTIVILKELLQCIHIRVEILLTPSSYKILMPHYCVFVNAIFKRLPAADGSAEAKVIIDMLRMIIISVNFEEDCVMNAYQLISAVAAGLGNDFMGHIHDIVPTILCSLAEKRVCAAAVELLFEINTASGPFPSPVYEDIVDALMRMLSLFPVALDIEPKLIGCIGDFTRMMPGVSGDSAVASRECLTQVGVNNGNLVNDLRIAVLSAYKDIFSKIKKERKLSFFPEYVSHCACFLQSLQTSHSGKDNRVLAKAVDLISDVYDNVAEEDVLQSPASFDEFVDTFIDEAKDATDDETRLSAHRLSGILQAMTKKEFVPYQSEY
ncbi:hypothetical protein MPSEU_000891200 [Mayamaea pseudoterrestris]|nr:hypothetical protein MPSEU_000891200 [Mayamaea pseudoterrestris]